MCLNYVQGGKCYATRQDCLLGQNGASAPNDSGKCSLHGKFDVWVTHDDRLLISDLGFPSEEPKQSLALGITEDLAAEIARKRSRELGTRIVTTERMCLGCSKGYWYSGHENSKGVEIGRGYLCPDCLRNETEQGFATKLGSLGYWCG
jgi:hypothetical protein